MTFDHIAPIYDRLAQIVYGKAIFRSQVFHFNRIKPAARILIPGGGTGWILRYLPADCKEVVYVDPSLKMIEKARKVHVTFPVTFHHSQIENTKLNGKFDVVITNFFFDMFHGEDVKHITGKVSNQLAESGVLLVTDFRNTSVWWQRGLLAVMYLFFRIMAGLHARRLSDWKNILMKNGFTPVVEATFYRGFIASAIFCKTNFTA